MGRRVVRAVSRLAVAGVSAVLAAGLTVAVVAPADARQQVPGPGYQARITRTAHGIPHIVAANLPSAGFGYGYAFAQDNLCVLAESAVTLAGERSKYFGQDGIADDGLSKVVNADSDVYHRALNSSGLIDRLVDTQPSTATKLLVRGYVAGVNNYLRRVGVAHLPDPTCRGKSWVRPVTELDVWRNIYDFNQLGGTGSVIEQIARATPPAPDTVRNNSLPAVLPRPKAGSNGWALGGQRTTTGRGMVLGNPHFPWHGPRRFYQVQLTVPGRLNVTGASLYGTPMVVIGHNASLAWTHTVSTAQRYTLFQLALRPGDPTTYLVDGRPERMRKVAVPIEVRNADGSVSTVDRVVYRSRYGPVLAQGWTKRSAFAIGGASAHNLRDVDEWLAIAGARSVRDLDAVQRAHQSLPFVNTIAADSAGTAYFADASVVPHVTDAQARRCVDTPEGKQRYPRQIVLNGSRSACDWANDPDAVQSGTFGPSYWPRMIRRDYVANSNESPWLTNATAPLTGYQRIFGDIAQELSPRDRLSHAMLARGRFDLPRLRATMLNNRDLSAELFRADTVRFCRADPRLVASGACRVLARWSGRTDVSSRGAVLWREIVLRLLAVPELYRVPFDPRHPVSTPNTLNTTNPAVRQALTGALTDAIARLRALHLPLDVPLGATQRGGTPPSSVPVGGCSGAEGCFNKITTESSLLREDRTYGDTVNGSSFIMAVSLTPAGPRASTILTYSQSSNPRSPYHADQTRLYARKQWVTDRFTPAEIAADPHAHTMVLAGR